MRRWLLALVGMVTIVLSVRTLAGIATFTDRSAWLRAAGDPPTVSLNFNEFNRDLSFAGEPLAFNAFNFGPGFGLTASVWGGASPADGNLLDSPPFLDPDRPAFDTPHLRLYGNGGTVPRFQFSVPATAFGVQVKVLEGQSQLVLQPAGKVPMIIAGPIRDGFFGIVSDTPFNAFNFNVAVSADRSDPTAAATSFRLALDDFEAFSTPEPMTLTLVLSGAILLTAHLGWRRRMRRAGAR